MVTARGARELTSRVLARVAVTATEGQGHLVFVESAEPRP
jgi:hypothetical protein